MSAGRKEWREGERERRKDERKEGGREGRKEGEGDISNTALAAASRSNRWHLPELPLNEGQSYQVFALLLYT